MPWHYKPRPPRTPPKPVRNIILRQIMFKLLIDESAAFNVQASSRITERDLPLLYPIGVTHRVNIDAVSIQKGRPFSLPVSLQVLESSCDTNTSALDPSYRPKIQRMVDRGSNNMARARWRNPSHTLLLTPGLQIRVSWETHYPSSRTHQIPLALHASQLLRGIPSSHPLLFRPTSPGNPLDRHIV